MKICVLGLGYVGAVSCGCLAALGHTLVGVDIAEQKVDRINRGESPIIEEGLSEILRKAVDEGRLTATTDTAAALKDADIALVCVGTPSTDTGGVNSMYLERVCEQIAEAVKKRNGRFLAVLNRSTSLPHVHRKLQEILEKETGRKLGDGIGYVCHPEFLREGRSRLATSITHRKSSTAQAIRTAKNCASNSIPALKPRRSSSALMLLPWSSMPTTVSMRSK